MPISSTYIIYCKIFLLNYIFKLKKNNTSFVFPNIKDHIYVFGLICLTINIILIRKMRDILINAVLFYDLQPAILMFLLLVYIGQAFNLVWELRQCSCMFLVNIVNYFNFLPWVTWISMNKIQFLNITIYLFEKKKDFVVFCPPSQCHSK